MLTLTKDVLEAMESEGLDHEIGDLPLSNRSKFFPKFESEPKIKLASDPAAAAPAATAPVAAPAAAPTAACNVPFFLFFDTETTGLCRPHVLQLAFMAFDDNGTELFRYNKIFKLFPGKKIEKSAENVHGISLRTTLMKGVDPLPELEHFLDLCLKVNERGGKVVAHNADFDCRAFNTTLLAWKQNAVQLDRSLLFCTMKASKTHSPLVDKRGCRKVFRNDELYKFLHGHEPDVALHDALNDVIVTSRNFFTARTKNWW